MAVLALCAVLLLAAPVAAQPRSNGFVGLDNNNNLLVSAPEGANVTMVGATLTANGVDLVAALRSLAALAQDVSTLTAANNDKNAQLSTMTAQLSTLTRSNLAKDTQISSMVAQLASTSTSLQQVQSSVLNVSANTTQQLAQLNASIASTQGQALSATRQQVTAEFSSALAQTQRSVMQVSSASLESMQQYVFYRDYVGLMAIPTTLLRASGGVPSIGYITGLAELSDGVAVVDVTTNKLTRITLGLSFPAITQPNISAFNFVKPVALLAIGPHFISIDSSNRRLQRFNETVLVWSSPFPPLLGAKAQSDLCLLPGGRILVSDLDATGPLIFDATNGSYIGLMAFNESGQRQADLDVWGMAFDIETSTLFLAEARLRQVLFVALNTTTWAFQVTQTFALAGLPFEPAGLAYHAPSKSLFVGSTSSNRILVLDVEKLTTRFIPCRHNACPRPYIRSFGGFGLYVSAYTTSDNPNNALYLY